MKIVNHLVQLMGEKQAREGRTINVSTVTKEIGLSRSALYPWINNKITRFEADTLIKLCAYFDCTVGDLLEYIPDDAPSEA